MCGRHGGIKENVRVIVMTQEHQTMPEHVFPCYGSLPPTFQESQHQFPAEYCLSVAQGTVASFEVCTPCSPDIIAKALTMTAWSTFLQKTKM